MRCLSLLIVLAASACSYTQIRQSSLVPVPEMPPPVSMQGRGDIYFGDSLATVLGTRQLRENENAGLWLARHQLDGAASLRLSRFFSLRLLGGMALAIDATAASPTTLRNPGRQAPWGGLGTIVHFLDASGFGVDGELDTMALAVPSVLQSRECMSHWDGPDTCSAWGPDQDTTDVVPMLAGTLRAHYTAAPWITVWAGATVRNHPTNDAAFTDIVTTSSVRMGPPTLVIGLGAELTIERVVSILPHMTWPVAGGPVDYGPMFGIAVRVHLGPGPGDDREPWTTTPEPESAPPMPFPMMKPPPSASPPPAGQSWVDSVTLRGLSAR